MVRCGAHGREHDRRVPAVRVARLFPAFGAAAILLPCLATYAPARHARFLQDDHPIVQLNPIVRRGNWIEIFSTDYWGGVGGSDECLYRPVTILSFALERRSDGSVDPGGAHVTNILLHALASLALAGLALRLGAGPWTSILAGLLFALHPIHVSVVGGLVGRAEILAALFMLAALLCQSGAGEWSVPGARPTSPGETIQRIASWAAALCVFLALGSKEVALAAPLLLLAMELSFRPPARAASLSRWLVERAAALAPSALAVVLYAVLRTRALGVFPGVQRVRLSENVLVGLDGLERSATALGLLGRYLRLLFFPHPLSADYSGKVIEIERSLLAPLPLAGVLGLGLLVVVALAPFVRRSLGRGPLLCASFASVLFLLPYATIGNLFVLVGIGFAERFVYLPSVGFCLLLALVLGRAFAFDAVRATTAGAATGRRIAGCVLLTMVLAAAALEARASTFDWQTDETLFEAATRATEASPRAQFTLAKIRLDQGRDDEALARFRRTVQLWPQFSSAWYEMGLLQAKRGDRESAERSLREAVRLNPWHAGAAAALGDLLLAGGRYEEGSALYRRAARLGRTDVLPRLRESAGQRSDRARAPIP